MKTIFLGNTDLGQLEFSSPDKNITVNTGADSKLEAKVSVGDVRPPKDFELIICSDSSIEVSDEFGLTTILKDSNFGRVSVYQIPHQPKFWINFENGISNNPDYAEKMWDYFLKDIKTKNIKEIVKSHYYGDLSFTKKITKFPESKRKDIIEYTLTWNKYARIDIKTNGQIVILDNWDQESASKSYKLTAEEQKKFQEYIKLIDI